MSGGFFGLVIQPGKTYEQINELPLRITMASIGQNEEGKTGMEKTYLKYRSDDDQEFVVCSLIPDKHETQLIELMFEPGESLTFLTTGDCPVHLIGHYVLEDLPPMGDSDDDEMYDSEEDDQELDEEIDSDDAGELDPKIFGGRKQPLSKKALMLLARNAAGKESEEGEGEDGEEEDGLDEEALMRAAGWMDVDDDDEDADDEDDDEMSGIDLFRLAAGVKRKANGEPIPLPPAGKKAKIVEIVEETAETKKTTATANGNTASSTSSIAPADAEPKANGTASNKDKKGDKKQKEKKNAANKQQAAEKKETSQAKASNAGKQVNGGKEAPVSAKAMAKQVEKTQKEDSASSSPAASEKKTNNDSSPNKAAESKQENNAQKGEKQPKKKSLPSGLQYEDISVGTGQRAKNGKRVAVRYVGKLVSNGKVFDSNTTGEPFKFQLGKQEVIRGWDIGVNGMSVGGTRKIVVPPALAYGSKGAPPSIPTNATLEFEVKLLEVK